VPMLQVLMVDDDPIQLRIREAILRSAGFIVHVATNVESALAFLRSMGSKVGIVVTDHCLPGRTGADLVRELRLTAPSLPVLVLSGMPGIEEEYVGLNVNVQLKPFPPDEFIRVVQNSLLANEG
jgi:CheY-like chemotaxis protein